MKGFVNMNITKMVDLGDMQGWTISNLKLQIMENVRTGNSAISITDEDGFGKIKKVSKEELQTLKRLFEIED